MTKRDSRSIRTRWLSALTIIGLLLVLFPGGGADATPESPEGLGPSDCADVAGNVVVNPEFANTANWTYFTDGAGSFTSANTGSVCDPAARLGITTAGSNVQLYQSGIALEAATEYTLSFRAKSSTAHDMGVYLQRHSAPYTNYGLNPPTLNLTTAWQTFNLPFTTTGFAGTTTDTRLRFWLAPFDANGDVYSIDSVVLMKTTSPPPPPCEPVPGNIIQNPGFESGTSGWSFFTSATGSFSAMTTDPFECLRSGKVVITSTGSNMQLNQTPLPLQPDTEYRLRFAARSSNGSNLTVAVHKNGAPYTSYGLSLPTVDVATSWTTYTYDFTTTAGAGTDARLRFTFNPHAVAGTQYFFDAISLAPVTVDPSNEAPVAEAGSATTDEDTASDPITLSATDADGDLTTFSISTAPANGALSSITPGSCTGTTPKTCTATVTYTPDSNFSGSDSFQYVANDGTADSAAATVSLTVDPVNDAPAVDDATFSVNENAPDGTAVGTVTFSDPDAADTHTFAITAGDAGGAFAIDTTGKITVADGTQLDFEATPSYSLTVTVTDNGSPNLSGTGTITVNVNDVADNNAPTVDDATFTVAESSANATSVGTVTFSDPDAGDTLTFAITAGNSSGAFAIDNLGEITVADGTQLDFETTPSYSLTVTVTDSGSLTDTAAVTVNVTDVNDPPVADDESFSGVDRAVGNTSLVVDDPSDGAPDPVGPQKTITGDLLTGDTDQDGTGSLAVVAGTFATDDGGTVDIQADGDFVFHPKNATSCTDHSDFFDYTVTDQNAAKPPGSAATDVGRVTIEIQDCVWYVDSSLGVNGDGRSQTPFNSLTGVNGAGGSGDADASGARIFLYDGAYAGGLPLEASQLLSGQRHGLTVPDGGVGVVVLEPAVPQSGGGAASTITGGLILSTGNTIQGIDLGNAAGAALSGTSVGTAVMNTVTGGEIDNQTGAAVAITTGVLNLVFQKVSSTGSTGSGISLAGVSGTFDAAAGTLTDAASADVSLTAGSADFTYSGDVADAMGTLVLVSGETGGVKDFNGLIDGSGDVSDGGGIVLTNNTGATIRFDGGLTLSSASNPAFTATGGGIVSATQDNASIVNTVTTTTGAALNIVNTNIGASGLTFRSISSDGAATGINLNNTGSTGGLTVTGNGGTCTSAATCTGGAIQNASVGISLAGTTAPSFDQLLVDNTTGSGIDGTDVTGFTFTDGKIDRSGTAGAALTANIAFNRQTGTENNLDGVVVITGNTLTNSFTHGISIYSFAGTISDATISNNAITSSTSTATSKGSGIQLVGFGNASTVASITKATLAQNTITNFPSDAGIIVQGGNTTSESAPAGTYGSPGSGISVITISDNTISGASAANRIGTQGILNTFTGRAQANVIVDGNDISHTTGNSISINTFGDATVVESVTNNTIVANNGFSASGIAGGTGLTGGFATNTPSLTATVTGNNVSGTDGNGILLVARDNATGVLNVGIRSNTVSAPIGGVRPGIRVDAGNATGDNDVCADISSNTSAGSGGSQGIGLRKQGTDPAVNAFGVEGMAATSTPGVEAYVSTANPAGNGTLLISATSGFTNCSSAP